MHVRVRSRNLIETRLLQLGEVNLVMEHQFPDTPFSIVAVSGCSMPIASIHTNHERRVSVDVLRAIEPISMEVHMSKPVLESANGLPAVALIAT